MEIYRYDLEVELDFDTEDNASIGRIEVYVFCDNCKTETNWII